MNANQKQLNQLISKQKEKKITSKTKQSRIKIYCNFYNNFLLKSIIITIIIISLINLTNSSGGSETTSVEDWESLNFNKTGKCESIISPTTETECFSQTNETHSCCMVKLNGTYKDPTIIDLYPELVVSHGVGLLSSVANTQDLSHTTSSSQHQNKSLQEFKRCVAVFKSEKAITSMVRKFTYNGTLFNSYFVCNTTLTVNPCGMAQPGKFQDCKSHSSAKKKCCLVSYLDIKTCKIDLGLANNNSNHLGVNFECNASSIKFDFKIILFFVLVLVFGVFV